MKESELDTAGIAESELGREIEAEVKQEMIRLAQGAYKKAYAPYSHYPVGAAALFSSGKLFPGCNVENISYGLTVCAERNAIFRAVVQGERQLEGIAIAVPTDEFPSPCGACRQVMREFAVDCPIILINGSGKVRETSLKALLPDAFCEIRKSK